MDEVMQFVHEQRTAGYTFSIIAGRLQAKYQVSVTRRVLNDQYAKWCRRNFISPVRDTRTYVYEKTGGKRGKIKYNQDDLNKRDCLLHLIDLVRAHGEIVTNSLTGEVVEGGFPNVNIPDVGTPIVMNSHYHGSMIGSAALSCVEFGK